MLLKKEGFPEEDELVLCTVTKIFAYGVFVDLDEYGKGGMIHISEVSPGRIRNIRDFVVEGKKVVCKVLRINEEKGYIDLSLRRVNEGQKREKINLINQEQKPEKIIVYTTKKLGVNAPDLYKDVAPKILVKYGLLNLCFEDIVIGNVSLEELGVDKKVAEILTHFIRERMKPPEVIIRGELKLKSYAPDGIEIIKEALTKGEDKNIHIVYEGGGKYKIEVKASEYKDAEKILEKSEHNVINFMEKKGGEGEFVKEER